MGQSSSSLQDDEMSLDSGVRITQGLLERLDGKPTQRKPPGGGGRAATRSGEQRESAAAAAALVMQDRSMARLLERSKRVGTMLLKADGEEVERIDELAGELLAREYATPSRPRPCTQQADDCVRCYANHAADPLACAAAVDAYSACAKAAWQEALQRGVTS
ncbi:hypothetical protein D9Q98_005656 [Chlorella vulgaris]|uniref:Uncharacterized protein n=1 Tax=Chlorella vulgaris TaxID=3077 RepID=A0A9D4TMH3_CHLVU|nr:hypothetical protein D9Q98_005656 [Chlorella vulgaris]